MSQEKEILPTVRECLEQSLNRGRRPHDRHMRVTRAFIPEWRMVTGFHEGVALTPELRREGLRKLAARVKRELAGALERRCERGADPVHAPWSRKLLGGVRCARPFSERDAADEERELAAAFAEGREPRLDASKSQVNLCGKSGARLPEVVAGAAGAPPAVGAELLAAPPDQFPGWEPSHELSWSLGLAERRLNAYFREATGISVREMTDVLCARDAAFRLARLAERELATLLDELLVDARAHERSAGVRAGSTAAVPAASGPAREESPLTPAAFDRLVLRVRRLWTLRRKARGWDPSRRALKAGYRNHARLRQALLLMDEDTPDGLEVQVLRNVLGRRFLKNKSALQDTKAETNSAASESKKDAEAENTMRNPDAIKEPSTDDKESITLKDDDPNAPSAFFSQEKSA